ncbi:MAG: dioxygenase [Acidimicrobiia bacterium]
MQGRQGSQLTDSDSAHTRAAQQELLASVLQRYEGTTNERLREVMEAAVRHLHAFAAEVGLTREEWFAGIQFMTATGQKCDDVRQEFILLSDTLGLSTLVELITYEAVEGATENTVLGPFYVPGSQEPGDSGSIVVGDDAGEQVLIRGTVTGPDGVPVPDATIDVWQTASNGFYAVQQPGVQDPQNCRGLFHTDEQGRYSFRTVRPHDYPIPGDGPVGALLAATGRGLMRAAHTHIMASAPGFKTLITHVFDADSIHLQDDAVFGVRDSLVRDFNSSDGSEAVVEFDIVLVPTEPASAP